MSRILVVQPSRMLQQALAFVLASEHQIRVTDILPESAAAPEVDLVIVDAAVLREDELAVGKLDALYRWQIPVVWLGAGLPPIDSVPGNSVSLPSPLDRESLTKAVADILRSSTRETPQPAITKFATADALEQTTAKAMQSNPAAAENEQEVIELVEVVEEQPARDMIKTDADNKA